jgi:hypothetical protein
MMQIRYTKQDRFDIADGTLMAARSAIENLIAVTKSEFALGKLGGILADLKTAQNELNEINNTGN